MPLFFAQKVHRRHLCPNRQPGV
ncbi:unnamed protein product [Kuraishia capsulata CBS 1993]|uniref:Uncharacterized protein n=1 Tax=Kuraishia capsulata CBS 1993 TaxID=1382522 RepID=W6MWH5_9ASCO|nr:unnamed protein product [Kuraishia capsulata CBS 1993]